MVESGFHLFFFEFRASVNVFYILWHLNFCKMFSLMDLLLGIGFYVKLRIRNVLNNSTLRRLPKSFN
jgi:hypothetical protein